MMWVFGQVWLLCLLAFVIGAGLYHLLFTRPLRKQVRQLEIQLAKAKRADAMPPPQPPVDGAVAQTGVVDEHPPPATGWDPTRLPSWEREQAAEPPRTLITPQPEHDLGYDRPEPHYEAPEPIADRSFEQPAEHDYHAEPEAEPEPEPAAAEPEPAVAAEPEPEPEPVAEAESPQPPADEQPTQIQPQVQPAGDERPTQIQAAVPAPPPIPNPSPAEMTAVISRLAGEASAAETTSILPPARDDHEDMELADVGPVASAPQLAHAPADDLDDEHLVDDVVEEELSQSEREQAAETTGPVAVSVIAAAEKAVQQRRAAGELADEEPAPEAVSRHSLVEEPAPKPFEPVQAYNAPAAQPFEPVQAYSDPEPEAEAGEVQLEALAEPIRLDPNQFGKPIPPGSLTPPGSVTPPEPAESSTPLPTRPARQEPAPMEAVSRSRSLFEPVLDPEGEDPYEDLDGFQPIQEPTTRSFSSTDSVPFTPILAPELLASEQPKPPVVTSTPAGLPKRTVSSSWPRGGNGLSAGPQPFDPAPFRPRQAFNPMPRNTDQAPIRRPSSGGPRTPFGPGSALPKPDGSAPSDEYQVKAMLGTRTYHPAGSGDFDGVKAEVWFRNAEEAERAGFSPAE